MSRNFAVLNKSAPGSSTDTVGAPSTPRAEYAELIARIFKGPTVVALVRSAQGEAAKSVCNELAAEIGQSGRRVVVVDVRTVLRISPVPVPDSTEIVSGPSRNTWYWPSLSGPDIDFFKIRSETVEGNWLDLLRTRFDSVLLDCPSLDLAPGAASIAALANSTVLVVEAGQTSKQRIVVDLRALQSADAHVVGSILINGN